jgi:hypothetical protein
MDHLQTRLDALEQRTYTVERQLRWWRGVAGGLLVLAVLTWALPIGTAQETGRGGEAGLAQRLVALEQKLRHLTLVTGTGEPPEMRITGANLRLVNGLGGTDCTDDQSNPIPDCPNGLGNLIVGYNEPRAPFFPDVGTGSHNVVVGQHHNFSRFGGIVVGDFNTISGDFSSVSGGELNTASGFGAAVSGGQSNIASLGNAAVSGGENNTATGFGAMISGGFGNAASGDFAAVSGGQGRTAAGDFDWVAGPLFADE